MIKGKNFIYKSHITSFQIKEEGKDLESIDPIPHLTQDTIWEMRKPEENIIFQKASPANNHKAARN